MVRAGATGGGSSTSGVLAVRPASRTGSVAHKFARTASAPAFDASARTTQSRRPGTNSALQQVALAQTSGGRPSSGSGAHSESFQDLLTETRQMAQRWHHDPYVTSWPSKLKAQEAKDFLMDIYLGDVLHGFEIGEKVGFGPDFDKLGTILGAGPTIGLLELREDIDDEGKLVPIQLLKVDNLKRLSRPELLAMQMRQKRGTL